jgi:hypothetical protein
VSLKDDINKEYLRESIKELLEDSWPLILEQGGQNLVDDLVDVCYNSIYDMSDELYKIVDEELDEKEVKEYEELLHELRLEENEPDEGEETIL